MTAKTVETILVTGAAGFIGARVVERLRARGFDVVSVDTPGFFQTRPEHAGVDFGAIVDFENLFDWLAEKRPKLRAFIHMGACSDTTELDEAYLKRVNVDYSKAAWTWCAEHGVPFVYASSAATYGAGELGYDDDESMTARLKPLNPYGESKRVFDEWAVAEEKKGHHPPAWSGFRFFNVYGFGERHKRKMASVVLHAYDQIFAAGDAGAGTVKLFQSHKDGIKDGEQQRDFIFVEDVVDVLLYAFEKPIRRGIYNLGTGHARTFLDLVRATFQALGKAERIEFVPTPEALRARYQYFTEATMERLRREGYAKPFTSLEDGVHQYVARLQDHRSTRR